jgi:hypothetical protein
MFDFSKQTENEIKKVQDVAIKFQQIQNEQQTKSK